MQTRNWHKLEHYLYRLLTKHNLIDKRFLIMLSGGCDSTSLLLAFVSVASAAKLKLQALHIHHGIHKNLVFRDQSLDFVKKLCQQNNIELEVAENENPNLSNEEELREFRKQEVNKRIKDFDIIVWGHHQDDLMETRLIRLIRGTGPQGLTAMTKLQGENFRPWLGVSRVELEEYLKDLSQSFMQDPDLEDQRSWLRNTWLKQLESKYPGSQKSLARSLENLSTHFNENSDLPDEKNQEFLSRQEFMSFSVEKQKSILAKYLLDLGSRNFTRGQIEEILKQLDKTQIVHSFTVGGLNWSINAKQIRAKKLTS